MSDRRETSALVDRIVRSGRRRATLDLALRGIGRGVAFGAGLAAAVVLAQRLIPALEPLWESVPGERLAWIGVPGVSVLLLSVTQSLRQRPSRLDAAIAVDRALNLDDRVGTLESLGGPGPSTRQPDPEFTALIEAEATRRLRGVQIGAAFPIRALPHLGAGAAAAGLFALIAWITPQRERQLDPAALAGLAVAEETRDLASQAEQTIDEILNDLDETDLVADGGASNDSGVGDGSDPRSPGADPVVAERLAALERLSEQLRQPADPAQFAETRDRAAAEVDAIADELERQATAATERADAAAERFAALATPEGTSPPLTDAFDRALREGRFGDAAEALEELAARSNRDSAVGGLSDQERAALARHFREMAQRAEAIEEAEAAAAAAAAEGSQSPDAAANPGDDGEARPREADRQDASSEERPGGATEGSPPESGASDAPPMPREGSGQTPPASPPAAAPAPPAAPSSTPPATSPATPPSTPPQAPPATPSSSPGATPPPTPPATPPANTPTVPKPQPPTDPQTNPQTNPQSSPPSSPQSNPPAGSDPQRPAERAVPGQEGSEGNSPERSGAEQAAQDAASQDQSARSRETGDAPRREGATGESTPRESSPRQTGAEGASPSTEPNASRSSSQSGERMSEALREAAERMERGETGSEDGRTPPQSAAEGAPNAPNAADAPNATNAERQEDNTERAADPSRDGATRSPADRPSGSAPGQSDAPAEGGRREDGARALERQLREIAESRRVAGERSAASERLREQAEQIAGGRSRDEQMKHDRFRAADAAPQHPDAGDPRRPEAPASASQESPAAATRNPAASDPRDSSEGPDRADAASSPDAPRASTASSATTPSTVPPTTTEEIDLTGASGRGETIAQWFTDEAATEGGTSSIVAERAAQAGRAAERAIERSALPSRYHSLMRRYFGRLPETAQGAGPKSAPPAGRSGPGTP